MTNLKAIIVDHACQLDSYILERDADMLQYILYLLIEAIGTDRIK